MPFTGATFSILTNTWYPAVEDTVMESADSNSVLEDIANGLTQVLTRDGSGTMSGALNMGNNKITSLDSATNPGDAPRFDQVQPVDATLTAIAALSFDATNNLMYSTGADTFALLASTAAGRAFLTYVDPGADKIPYWKDADGTIDNIAFSTGLSFTGGTLTLSTNLQTYSGITPSANVQSFLGAADYAAMRTLLSLTSLATTSPGTGVTTALGVNVGSAGAFVVNGGALGTPSSGTLTSCTGLPVSSGISGLGSGVATFLATPSFSNLSSAVTGTWNLPSGSQVNSSSIVTVSGATFTGDVAVQKANARLDVTNNSGTSATVQLAADSGLAYVHTTTNTDLIMRANNVEFARGKPSGDFQITAAPTSLATNSAGFRGLGALNVQTTDYTFVLGDSGQLVVHGSASPHSFTIPPNSSVAFPLATVIPVNNTSGGGTLSILEGAGVTLLRGDGVSGSGTRTMASAAIASLVKVNTNVWEIIGAFS